MLVRQQRRFGVGEKFAADGEEIPNALPGLARGRRHEVVCGDVGRLAVTGLCRSNFWAGRLNGGQDVERVIIRGVKVQRRLRRLFGFGDSPFVPMIAGQSSMSGNTARFDADGCDKIYPRAFVILHHIGEQAALAQNLRILRRKIHRTAQRPQRGGKVAAIQTLLGEFERVTEQVLNRFGRDVGHKI